nr:ACP S-malonyltransferase [uncultured Rhodopila sp.]
MPSRIMLFPGQGSQKKGMGADLFDLFPAETAAADAILGYSVRHQCLEDPGGTLRQTRITQPMMYLVSSLMCLKRLHETRRAPDLVAGHSVGEFAALFAAGVFNFETGLRIVQKRGELMGRVSGGGMAAVIGLPAGNVRDLLHTRGLETIDIANLNAPKQTVISGPQADILAARQTFDDAGAQMFVPLEVSAAFHSRYMEPVRAEFKAFVCDIRFYPPRIPVIANVTARPYEPSAIIETMTEQITSPVRWVESVQYLLQQPDPEFEELGPGNVLTSLLRQIRTAAQ